MKFLVELAIASLLVVAVARGQAQSPQDELKSFQLADERLMVELVAAEPDVFSPVAIAWDSAGRMFVAEMMDYPLGPGGGQIRLLEDRDHDGHYDIATVFADKLPFPNGVLPWNGGVLVTAAPDILFLKDNDGDGHADERKILVTGFGEGNQQLRVNGLFLGLDGWVYGANGRSDGEIHKPDDSKTFSLRGHDFRFRPENGEIELLAGRSQFGTTRDDYGTRFLSWNTIPIRHEVLPEKLLLRNKRLNVTEGVQNLLPDGDNGEVFPLAPTPQTFNSESTKHFNALAGLTIYRGTLLPGEYKGNAFMGEALLSLVHRRVLDADGVTFQARRAEQGKEFLASTDPWFHPVNFATGPEGALYVVDFYRQWVEHPGYVPEKLRDKFPWRTGAEHGRIWRIRSKTAKAPKMPEDLSRKTTAEVVQSFQNPNGWVRDTALRVLGERQDREALGPLRQVASESTAPEARVEALYGLEQQKRLDEKTLHAALSDRSPRVRHAALRLTEGRLKTSEALSSGLIALASDSDARVRLRAALLSAELEPARRRTVLTKIALRPDLDRFTALAIRSSMGGEAETILSALWKTLPTGPAAALELIRDLAQEISEIGRTDLLPVLADPKMLPIKEYHLALFTGLARGLTSSDGDRSGGRSGREVLQNWASGYQEFVSKLIRAANNFVRDGDSSALERGLGAETLARIGTPESNRALVNLLEPANPEAIQTAATTAFSDSADRRLLEDALEKWPTFQVSTRRKLLTAAAHNRAMQSLLADAMEKGTLAAAELDANLRRNLVENGTPELKPRFQQLLGSQGTDRAALVEKFRPALQMEGDAKRGAATFGKVCLQCHVIEGRGQQVGPDLSGIASRPKEALLVDIIDPSKDVSADFVAYTVTEPSGDSLVGLIASENENGVTLRRGALPDELIPRERIKKLQASGKSLMPDGLEAGMSPQDFADLLKFLGAPKRDLIPE